MTAWDINSTEEDAGMCTERPIDELQRGMFEISFLEIFIYKNLFWTKEKFYTLNKTFYYEVTKSPWDMSMIRSI